METNYTLRQVRAEDLAGVAALEAACFPAAEAATPAALQARIAAFPESFLVAEDGAGQVVGMINGCAAASPAITDEMFTDVSLHNPAGAWQTVFGLDVLPAWRRRGVAAALMQALIAAARRAGRPGLVLTCKQALIPYYEKFGYCCLGVSGSVHGGAVWYDMVLAFEPTGGERQFDRK